MEWAARHGSYSFLRREQRRSAAGGGTASGQRPRSAGRTSDPSLSRSRGSAGGGEAFPGQERGSDDGKTANVILQKDEEADRRNYRPAGLSGLSRVESRGGDCLASLEGSGGTNVNKT